MRYAQFLGMKRLPRHALLPVTVHGVTENGVADMPHVHAQLVHPARLRLQPEKGKLFKPPDDVIYRARVLSLLMLYRHFLAVRRVPR